MSNAPDKVAVDEVVIQVTWRISTGKDGCYYYHRSCAEQPMLWRNPKAQTVPLAQVRGCVECFACGNLLTQRPFVREGRKAYSSASRRLEVTPSRSVEK